MKKALTWSIGLYESIFKKHSSFWAWEENRRNFYTDNVEFNIIEGAD